VVDYVTEYESLVNSVSYAKSKEYPMVPVQDITQECWLWFVEHPKKTKEWHALENKKDSTRLFARALHNATSRYCQYEKARTSGYEVTDVFYYKRDIVEELLPSVLSGEFTQPENINDVNSDRSSRTPSEGGNIVAMQADISRAFEKLKEDQQNVLYMWYETGKDSKSLAKLINLPNEKAARMRVTRAIDAIIKKLGGYAPYRDSDYPVVETQKEAG
jgi:DNA-directed RNA polymerase specialized sigma24 family protein